MNHDWVMFFLFGLNNNDTWRVFFIKVFFMTLIVSVVDFIQYAHGVK